MAVTIKILTDAHIEAITDLALNLSNPKIDRAILIKRFKDMFTQNNYECVGMFNADILIGITGLWYCTRHYSGRSVEIDHVYINPEYRNNGLGSKLMKWITDYLSEKNIEAIELNTYVQNHKSHKFYYNHGFKILGFHFLKTLNT